MDNGIQTVMAIDPSLTRTGVCLLRFDDTRPDFLEAELYAVKPAKEKKDANFIERSLSIVDQISNLVIEHKPRRVLLEVPEGKVTPQHGGGGSGLSKYGFLAGVMYSALMIPGGLSRCIEYGTIPIGSSFWTQGLSKAKRRQKALTSVPGLADIKDPGMDISDATAMAVWWLGVGRHKDRCLIS